MSKRAADWVNPATPNRLFVPVALIAILLLSMPNGRDWLRPAFLEETARNPSLLAASLFVYSALLVVWAARGATDIARWGSLIGQTVLVFLMVRIDGSAMLTMLMVPIAWQVGSMCRFIPAVAWMVWQAGTMAFLSWSANFCAEYCFTVGLCQGLCLFALYGAVTLKREQCNAAKLRQANAELRAAQQLLSDKARMGERLRISREIHDAWGHELTVLALLLEAACHGALTPEASAAVKQSRDLSRSLLSRVRDVVGALREVGGCDLPAALGQLADAIREPRIHLATEPDLGHVEPLQAHVLLRCAQEAVTNAARHAGAGNIWLNIANREGGILLTVRDDGRGVGGTLRPGNGLTGMRERLEGLGGQLQVDAASGTGLTLRAWVPTAQDVAA